MAKDLKQLFNKLREEIDWYANIKIPDETWKQIVEETTKEVLNNDIIRN